MCRIPVCALFFLSASLLFGQQQPQNQGQIPPSASPQSLPDQQSQQQPAANPQEKAGVNSQIQSNIDSALGSDPALSGTDVQAAVDDVNITLTGSVGSQAQLDRVLALVSPYQRYRRVVNKVKVH